MLLASWSTENGRHLPRRHIRLEVNISPPKKKFMSEVAHDSVVDRDISCSALRTEYHRAGVKGDA